MERRRIGVVGSLREKEIRVRDRYDKTKIDECIENLSAFPDLWRWYQAVRAKPGVQRAMRRSLDIALQLPQLPEEFKRGLFDESVLDH